jgi:hypothetical protein
MVYGLNVIQIDPSIRMMKDQMMKHGLTVHLLMLCYDTRGSWYIYYILVNRREQEEEANKKKDRQGEMDPDHALVLKQTALLLQSANSGVILAVTALYLELAPPSQLHIVVRPLVRLARNKRAMQYVVYANIATLASQQPVGNRIVCSVHI